MAGWLKGGVKGYVGVPRSGKTTKAIADARTDAAASGFPIATLDLGSSLSFAGIPHAACADEVLYDLYIRRTHPRVWTPSCIEEREKFWRMLATHGAAHVLCDEIKHLSEDGRLDPSLALAVTKWGHGERGAVTYYLTSQRPTFIHRDLWHGFTALYVFRTMAGADADRFKHEFGLPPERTTKLERGAYETVEIGFPES